MIATFLLSTNLKSASSMNRLRALCDVLGLEFYVGRPRMVRGPEFAVDRLALALVAVGAGFSDADWCLSVHARAQLLVAVYSLLGESAARMRE